MQLIEIAANLIAKLFSKGQRLAGDYRHVNVTITQRRRQFGADKTVADNHDLMTGIHRLKQLIGLRFAAQQMDPIEIAARQIGADWRRAAGDQQFVEGERLAILKDQPLLLGIQAAHGSLKSFNVIHHIRFQQLRHLADIHFARRHKFGQRGAVVRRIRFPLNQNHAAFEAFMAQTPQRCAARRSTTQHHIDRCGCSTANRRRGRHRFRIHQHPALFNAQRILFEIG